MFKEIADELKSILSDDPIEKIAHIPTKELAKTLELLLKINFEDVERVYNEKCSNFIRHVVIYKSDEDKITRDICMVNGTIRNIICIPTKVLSTSENNAISLCKSIVTYTFLKIDSIIDEYNGIMNGHSVVTATTTLAIPVIVCDVMRKLYSGASLPTIIYNSLIERLSHYKEAITVEGIQSILDLLDEDLTIEMLLDNSFIYAVKDDPKYPGIWGKKND